MIKILPPELANQIAAGEVVERPASVVKELCENALDAGARRIKIDVEAGGRRLIRVADDGVGMTPADALLSLQRHATSKLRAIEDLQKLETMGFRGEALPAIASVSRLALLTRPVEAIAGFRLEIEAGQGGEAREVGIPPGTTVEVRDLFYNVPARLKFLKSEATETAQVIDTVTRLALAHPLVHFTLRHNGRVSLDAPPSRDVGERVRAVLGPRVGARLLEGQGQPGSGALRIQVYLAPPDEALTTARGVLLYVASRPVRDRGLLAAVAAGYAGLLPPGRHPQAVVFVDLAGAEVDVNVHPQKAEVRFARPGEVYAAVKQAVALTIADGPWGEPAEPVEPLSETPELPGFATAASLPPAGYVASAAPRSAPDTTWLPTLGYLGQLEKSYLVCTSAGELVIVDLHNARELIAQRRLARAHAERRLRPQRLLFPATLAVDAALVAMAESWRAALAEVGFEVAATSPTTLMVRAAPADLPGAPEVALRELLVALLREPSASVPTLLAALACAFATRGGDQVGADEARALLEDLDGAYLGHERPHGRPVLMRVSVDELARRR